MRKRKRQMEQKDANMHKEQAYYAQRCCNISQDSKNYIIFNKNAQNGK